jgi:molecular chaperone DnaJ
MNPYEVLGISEDADEETIKKAYKELVKKYHPDKYVNNPLADLAAEKMKEINKAYDMLTKKNTGTYGNTPPHGSGGFTGGAYQNAKPTFSMVRQLLSMRRPAEAIMLLQQLPKTAEWYYLSGVADAQRGWYTQGIQNMEQAVRMDPNNTEYRDTLNNIKNRSASYTSGSGGYSSSGDCCPLPCFCLPCFCPGPCC